MHQQTLLLLQTEKEQIKQEEKEKEQEQKQEEVTIIINEGVCMKEKKVKSIYKIQHNVWYNRARRRFKKASYFSERA